MTMRIGQGYDIHTLVSGRRLMLGGVDIPSDLGEEAHSDGDVLIHAVIDSILGAMADGDIGRHFPPSDQRWKDADSRDLLGHVMKRLREARYEIVNLDTTVILERPKLAPHIDSIRASLASGMGVDASAVSVKAKTNEGQDSAGERRSVMAQAIVLVSLR